MFFAITTIISYSYPIPKMSFLLHHPSLMQCPYYSKTGFGMLIKLLNPFFAKFSTISLSLLLLLVIALLFSSSTMLALADDIAIEDISLFCINGCCPNLILPAKDRVTAGIEGIEGAAKVEAPSKAAIPPNSALAKPHRQIPDSACVWKPCLCLCLGCFLQYT